MNISLRSLAVLALMAASPALPVAAQAVPDSDADLLDFGQSQADAPTGWVDPQINNRRKCFDRPGRPEWVVNQPRGMEWRRMLIEQYVHLQARRTLIETGECTCETQYPNYEEYREEIEQLVSQFPASRAGFDDESSERLADLTRTISRRASRMSSEAGRLCRGF